ncbi:hypothetical protein CCGE525_19590 [Rhizobium jaguaris]|uniref:Uncharacterized protein n=1 Tax=Rhizobium jaguaris TaxID=1312183 RepID=A0A387FZW8_9HYPH|nr:hypothetical protein CCGE525_19590 [Rhizobium jaguaris]
MADGLIPSPLGEKVPVGRMRGALRAGGTVLRLRSGRSELPLLAPLIRRFAPPSPRRGEGRVAI